MKKNKSFNTLVLEKTIQDLQLSRLEASIFYRLLGFLLRDDKPFIYSAEKLAEKTLYKKRSIFNALKLLEEKELIQREGFSYRRRFIKGKSLVEICTHVQKLHGSELDTSAKTAEYRAKTAEYRAKTAYNKTSFEPSKHIGDLLQKSEKNPTKKILKWPELTEEQKECLSAYKHGLKYPAMQLTGFELQKGIALYRRENPEKKQG